MNSDLPTAEAHLHELGEAQSSTSSPPTVDCDTEVWVKARVLSAMRMALAIKKEQRVSADEVVFRSAFDGIANGAAVAVIHLLGREPSYVNLRKTYCSESLATVDRGSRS